MIRLLLISLTVLVIISGVVILTSPYRRESQVEAHAPHAGLDFSIAVDGDGDTVPDCNTTGGPTTCAATAGGSFRLQVYLNSLPTGANSYKAFDLFVTYVGVTSQNNADAHVWPGCVYEGSHFAAGQARWGCSIGTSGAPSNYTGLIGTNDFNCTPGASSGNTITIHHGVASGDTRLIERPGAIHAEGEGTQETLTVSCGPPTPAPTITNTPTDTPTSTNTPTSTPTPTPQADDDEDGDGIAHSIDSRPKVFSENFSDVYLGGNTVGTIFPAPGMTLSLTDVAFTLGIRAVGGGTGGPSTVVTFCSTLIRANILPGGDETITCASADVHINAGSAVNWFGPLIAKLNAGADVRVTEPSSGVYNVTNNGGSAVTVSGVAIAGGASANGLVDTDQDGLADSAETNIGSNSNDSDSDNDGISDGLEFALYGSSPLLTDTDGDGLSDPAEIGTYHTSPALRDTDGDRCPENKEIGPDQSQGGRRDPLNPYDYFNPTHDGMNRIDDVLAVVHQFFRDAGNPAYNPDTDRTLLGPNAWNLGPPNGQQRVDDILHQVHQFFHDCS